MIPRQQSRMLPPFGWYGATIPATFQANTGFPIGSLTVLNNTPASLAIFERLPSKLPAGLFPWGGMIVPAYYPEDIQLPGWSSFGFATDGTAVFSNSSLKITASEASTGQSLSPFGPGGWGAGAVPNSLVNVNPGDMLLGWQIQQIINLLTGVMTGQVVTLGVAQTDGSSWASTSKISAGSESTVHGNDFVEVLQLLIDASGAGISYEKAALLLQVITHDPSGVNSHDAVGIEVQSHIAGDNTAGRVWGASVQANVDAGGNGYVQGMELSINNHGSDQPNMATSTSKATLSIEAGGSAPCTAAIIIEGLGAGTGFHHGIYIDPLAIVSGGFGFEYGTKFTVDTLGNVAISKALTLTDYGTATGASYVATCNHICGLITTEGLTTPPGGNLVYTINNSLVVSTDIIHVTINRSNGAAVLTNVTPSNGSVLVELLNVGSVAFSSYITFTFDIIHTN